MSAQKMIFSCEKESGMEKTLSYVRITLLRPVESQEECLLSNFFREIFI
jgi:hypothetical protein